MKIATLPSVARNDGVAVDFAQVEAQQSGLKLSLHHHFNQPVTYRRDFDSFFGAIEDGSVGLTLDTARLTAPEIEGVAGIIRDFRHVIDNFRLKDFADGAFRVLGTDRREFAPILAAIKEIKYDGWVSADEESGSNIFGAMQDCFTFMKSGLLKTAQQVHSLCHSRIGGNDYVTAAKTRGIGHRSSFVRSAIEKEGVDGIQDD